ncbi:SDR family oxidoreductase [Paracoccaceae bacterium]|nr:SDR family oxidoreductase [Paracoccaceae bacterium]
MTKTVIISGASSGLGLEISETICDHYNLIVLGRRPPVKNIRFLYYIQADLSEKEAVSKLSVKEKKLIKNADILINNAGIFFEGNFSAFREEDYRKLFAVNLFSCIELTKLYLENRNEGRIININSIAGLRPQQKQEYYSASKFALRGFFESLTQDISPRIKVTNIYPAGINTTLWDKHPQREEQRNNFMDPKEVANFIKSIMILPNSLNINEIHMHPLNEG